MLTDLINGKVYDNTEKLIGTYFGEPLYSYTWSHILTSSEINTSDVQHINLNINAHKCISFKSILIDIAKVVHLPYTATYGASFNSDTYITGTTNVLIQMYKVYNVASSNLSRYVGAEIISHFEYIKS